MWGCLGRGSGTYVATATPLAQALTSLHFRPCLVTQRGQRGRGERLVLGVSAENHLYNSGELRWTQGAGTGHPQHPLCSPIPKDARTGTALHHWPWFSTGRREAGMFQACVQPQDSAQISGKLGECAPLLCSYSSCSSSSDFWGSLWSPCGWGDLLVVLVGNTPSPSPLLLCPYPHTNLQLAPLPARGLVGTI